MSTVGIYKPGQGYWTRMMTALGAGLLGFSGGAWLWSQLSLVATPFPVIYLQGAVVGVIGLVTAVLVYWVVGLNRKAVEFFIATEGEMQKVNWSTRREVVGSTWVVIGVSVVIALLLFVTDLAFSYFFQLINVLER